MRLLSNVSMKRALVFLLVLTVFGNCKKEDIPTDTSQAPSARLGLKSEGDNLNALALVSSQTRTATFLNNLNNFREVFGDQGYPKAKAGYVSADDGKYATTTKLNAKGISHSTLALQGFGFNIPADATIENIAVKVRRFKTGTPAIGDYFLTVIQRFQCAPGECTYGLFWTYMDDYPGKMYPNSETEYVFSQSGSGTNGGFNHNQAYQWTPAIVNHQYFGVRIDSYPPSGRGSVVINYDLVEVTVFYSVP